MPSSLSPLMPSAIPTSASSLSRRGLLAMTLSLSLAATVLVFSTPHASTTILAGPPIPLLSSSLHSTTTSTLSQKRLDSAAVDAAVARLYRRVQTLLRAQGSDAQHHAPLAHHGRLKRRAPQLAASDGSTIRVGDRYFRTQSLLSAMDTFYDSQEAKTLVDQAVLEQSVEEGAGGIGAGTDVWAAEALSKLQAGDTVFENEWANAGEHQVSQGRASEASWHATVHMAIRDLNNAKAVLDTAKTQLATDQAVLAPLQTTLTDATAAVTNAQADVTAKSTAVTDAQAAVTAAQSAHATNTASHTAAEAALGAKQTELDAAETAYRDALAALTDATGDSSMTTTDVAAVSDAQALVSTLEAQVAALTAEVATATDSHTSLSSSLSSSAASLATAEGAVTAAQSDLSTAQTTLTTAQGAQTSAQAAVDAQQAVVDATAADVASKQQVYDGLKEIVDTYQAKQTAASEKALLGAIEAYNRAIREWHMN